MKRFFLLLALVASVFASYALSAASFAQEPVAVEPTVDAGFKWYDATKWPVENKCWNDVDRYFARLPGRAHGKVTDAVWGNSQHSAGEVVRFRTNASTLKVRYKLWSANVAMAHMPATGVSGLDLYAYDEESRTWRWVAITQPRKQEEEKTWISGLEEKMRDYIVYLPLYNGIEALSIGVPEGAEFAALSPRADKPIVYYGTSIAHGGCASRPGNAFTAMISRRLDIPVVNLGFSGSAKMEIEVAELLGELDAEIFVLDASPNMTASMIAERAIPFIKKLREARPTTPILLVEDRWYGNSWILPSRNKTNADNHAELQKVFDTLKADDPNLYYLSAENLLGEDLDYDATVDGSHPNDLGMYRQANALEAVLRPILEKLRAEQK